MAMGEGEKYAIRGLLSQKFSKWKAMSFPSRESAEQATPEIVALYRANRAGDGKGQVAVDLCCGIGMDAIAMSRRRAFGKVYAFDIDAETIECAKANAKAYGADNIEFICAECTESDLGRIKPDFAFADPSRRVGGMRVKALSETKPDTLELIESIREAGVEDFCIEASHSLTPKELPADCEKEFITVEGVPNCTTLYFGKLKRSECSVVDLPSGKRIDADLVGGKIEAGPLQLRYLFELNEGIVRFGMQKQLHDSLGRAKEKIFPVEEMFFGSTQKAFSPFFANSFKILGEAGSIDGLKEKLSKLKAGKVVLRGKFEEKAQIELKKSLEEGLEGKLKLHAFFLGGKIYIAQNLGFK